VTAQGHPRAIFRRAIEHGNLIFAEGMALELGQVTLAEVLELERVTIEEATLAAARSPS